MISGCLAFLIFISVCDKEEPSSSVCSHRWTSAPCGRVTYLPVKFMFVVSSYLFMMLYGSTLLLTQWCLPCTYRAGPSSCRLFWKRGSLMSSTTRTGEKMNLKVNIFKPEGEDSRARRRLKSIRRYTFVWFADLILIFQRPGGPTSSLVWTGSDPERQICGLLDHKSPPKSTSRSRTS